MLVSRSGHSIDFKINEEKLLRLLELKRELGGKFPKFGVLVLSYNHSKLIGNTLSRIDSRLRYLISEIFIFDDNSPDDTFSVIKELLKTSPFKGQISVYKNPRNLRYGGNQKAGYQYAIEKGLDYVIMLHGDGQYAPEYLVDLMLPAVIEKSEVVFASRMMNKKDAIRGGMPWYKFLGNQVLTQFENIILGTRLTEFHSGYRMYSTSLLKKIPLLANTDDFHFDTEIIIQCRHLGVPIKEVPIQTFYGDEECNVNGFKYAFDVCKAVIMYRMHQLHLVRIGSYIVDREFLFKRKLSPTSSHHKILNFIKPCTKILCIGDSDGLLYEELSQKADTVIVVDEKDYNSTRISSENFVKSKFVELDNLDLKREYDYVILSDVLAMVAQPIDLLKAVKKLLKEDGYLIVSVPNIALWIYRLSLAIGRFNYANGGPLDRRNLRFYTKFSIAQELINSNFIIKDLKPTGLPFEVVFSSSGKSKLIKFLDMFYYQFAKYWHKLFSYQFVLTSQIATYETSKGEGKVI